MRIRSDLYRLFYEELWKDFYDKEQLQGNRLRPHAERLWYAKDDKGRFIVIEKILKFAALSERYFAKKTYELDPRKTIEGDVNSVAMCAALDYMGFRLQEDGRKLSYDQRAKQLLDLFVKETLYSEGVFGSAETLKKTDPEFAIIQQKQARIRSLNPLEEVALRVKEFYEAISIRNLDEAWNCLSSEFQTQSAWHGDKDNFLKAYQNTIRFREVSVFNSVEYAPSLADCMVYYEEEIAASYSSELASLRLMTLDSAAYFMTTIEHLKTRLAQVGQLSPSNVMLYKLFESDAAEYLWHVCKVPANKQEEICPLRPIIAVKRLSRCRCKLVNRRWFIDYLEGITTENPF